MTLSPNPAQPGPQPDVPARSRTATIGEPPGASRRATLLAVLVLLIAPAVLLGPALFGPRDYMPFDPATFPPASLLLDDATRATIEATPPNSDVTELPVLVVPELQLARAELADGRFPGWNPYARFGAPLYGNGLAAMAYPPDTALLLGFDPIHGLALGAWLGFAIAGVLAFALLRRLGLGVTAALLGGIVFGLGGTMTANAPFYMRANALVWLPGMLLACEAIADARRVARAPGAIGLAVCTAMTLLAGFPPFAVASLLLTGLWSVPKLYGAVRTAGVREAFALAAWLGAAVALGAALAAVQLAPMFAFFPESNRDVRPNLAVTIGQGFDPMGFLGYVTPRAFGEPNGTPPYDQSPLAHLLWSRQALDDTRGVPDFPHRYNFVEYAVYIGPLPLLLALLGACATRARRARIAIPLVVALFVLATAPMWLVPFFRLPVVASVPPMRYVGPVSLLVAVVAAAGFQALLDRSARRRAFAVGGLGIALGITCAVLAARSPLGDVESVTTALATRYAVPREIVPKVIPPAMMAAGAARLDAELGTAAWKFALAGVWLVVAAAVRDRATFRTGWLALGVCASLAELLLFAAPTNRGRELVVDATATPVHRFLLDQNDAHAADGGIRIARAAPLDAAGNPREPTDLPPGLLFPLRIRDLNSYAFVDPWSHRPLLTLYGTAQMIRGYWPRALPDDARLDLPFFDLIGLRYVVSATHLAHAGPAVGPALAHGEFFVHERPGALPRAFVVHATRALPDDDAVIAALLAPDLDPRAAVLVTDDVRDRLAASPAAAAAAPRAVRFVTDVPDRIELDVGGGPAGYLVLCDAPLHGWSATVDGRAVEIERGNLFMRVVPVPAGACRVAFRYTPPGLASGAAVSLAALLGIAALAFVAWRSRPVCRSSDPAESSATEHLD